MEAYLIFDIGKTNKKAILYNPDFEILEESSMHVAEIQDDDGFPDAMTDEGQRLGFGGN